MDCPFCAKRIWGEGYNPENGDRFYSHVDEEHTCGAYEVVLDVNGTWRKIEYGEPSDVGYA